MMEVSKLRIAVLNSHPIQYFAPLYSYLNKSKTIQVSALYLSDISIRGTRDPGFGVNVKWDINLLEGYDSKFIGQKATSRVPGGFWSLVAPSIWTEIRSGKYDVIWIHGYNYAANIVALVAAKSFGLPVMIRGETHLLLRRSGFRQLVRKYITRLIYRACDRYLAIGTRNREFYLAQGLPAEDVFLVPYAVDNARFISSSQLSASAIAQLRSSLGITPKRPIILFASKLVERKRPNDLILACGELKRRGVDFHLLMVGTGALQEGVHLLAEEIGITSQTTFSGFVNQSELPRIYAICDVFVLPSTDEPWGLVVNEVMCAAKPIVTTKETGCAADLVKHGWNGYLYEAGDVPGLAEVLATLLLDHQLRNEMGRNSLSLIADWGFEQCKVGLEQATKLWQKLPIRT